MVLRGDSLDEVSVRVVQLFLPNGGGGGGGGAGGGMTRLKV